MRTGPHARLSVTSNSSALRPACRATARSVYGAVVARFESALAFLMRRGAFTKRGRVAIQSD